MGPLVKGSPSTRLSGFQHHRQLKVMSGIRDSNTQEIEAGTSQTQGILDHRMLSGKNVYMTSLAPFKVIVQEGKIIDRNTFRSVALSSDAGR